MTQYKDTFTQGGQTQLHKLHMIRQVVGSTFKIGFGIFAGSFAIFVYWNHCWQDFWYLLCYFKAWIRMDYLSVLPRGFFDESWIMDSYGVVQHDPGLFIAAHRVLSGFKECALNELVQRIGV